MKLLKDLGDKNKTAEILEIPLKNIKRWEKNEIYRKEDSRKENDPEMEVKLKKWIFFHELCDNLRENLQFQKFFKNLS